MVPSELGITDVTATPLPETVALAVPSPPRFTPLTVVARGWPSAAINGGVTASTTRPPAALMTKLTPVVPPGVATRMMRSPATAPLARSSRTASELSALD